ncbi:MAG: hypothetical protein ACOH2V_06690 [Candidatus Saccharimonadaceae bacterium]
MKITKLNFTDLRKLELPAFAGTVIEIVDGHDPEALKINEVFEMLTAMQPEMDLLTVRHGPHPITEELTPLRQQRQMYASAVVFRMGMAVKKDENTQLSTVRDAKILVARYLHNLSLCKNEKETNEKVTKFFVDMAANTTLPTAFEGFGMSEDLNGLKIAQNTISQLLVQRLQSKSARTRLKTEDLAKIVREALSNVFKQIEVAQLKHPEINYRTLMNELNDLIIEYKKLINTRKLFNKRKAELAKANEEASNNESTNPEVAPAMRMNNLNEETAVENGFEERFAEQLDQKKIAAANSSSMQLSVIEKEANK